MTSDLTWQSILEAERFNQSSIANTMRMQYNIHKMTSVNGESLPLAVNVGESAQKPMIFTTAGELLERMAGKLFSESA
ncbi:hypothetical protein [Megalodesulfovibrio paquesii]